MSRRTGLSGSFHAFSFADANRPSQQNANSDGTQVSLIANIPAKFAFLPMDSN
jgi:hypothetical protein